MRVSQQTTLLYSGTLLAKLYHSQHQEGSAFHYQQQAMSAKDSLFGLEKFQRLQRLTLLEQQRQQLQAE
jgi:hypothetical protein